MANVVDIGPGELVAGDDHELDVSDAQVSQAGQVATDAWFTVKNVDTDPDSAAVIQKHVTTVNVQGTGQITNSGSNGQPVTIRFDLVPLDTSKLLPPLYQPWFRYDYDIQIKTAAGKIYTSVEGMIVADQQITTAS